MILDAGVAPVALVEERPASTWPPTLKLRRAKGLKERPESVRDLRSGSRSLDVIAAR